MSPINPEPKPGLGLFIFGGLAALATVSVTRRTGWAAAYFSAMADHAMVFFGRLFFNWKVNFSVEKFDFSTAQDFSTEKLPSTI